MDDISVCRFNTYEWVMVMSDAHKSTQSISSVGYFLPYLLSLINFSQQFLPFPLQNITQSTYFWMPSFDKHCAIVGAGACGLPCARWALAYGFQPTVFECRPQSQLGGLWRYSIASVMRCTVTNSSKEMTAYSDFPPPPHFPIYMRHEKMLAYLEAYAQHHNLEQYIRYDHKVVDIRRSADYARTGRWTLKWTDKRQQQGEQTFDCVLLCVGHHAKPKLPEWTGMCQFGGRVVHSHDFKWASAEFEGKVCVVVGAGDSGTDMAVELSRVAKEVYLSTRSGTWVLQKMADGGLPVDSVLTTRWNDVLMRYLPRAFNEWRLTRVFQRRLDHALYGLMPRHSVLTSQFFTVNEELPGKIQNGLVTVKPDIREFTQNGVLWADGTRTERVHALLLGTGYRFDFGLMENGTLIPVDTGDTNCAQLHLHMFPLASADWNTLAVIGIVQPTGSKLCVAEMQARYFFEVATCNARLPSREQMAAQMAAIPQQGPVRHAHEVSYIGYMDELASLVGCAPSLAAIFLQGQMHLFRRVLFGPNVAYVYRLRGPHKWEGAKPAILGVKRRTEECLRGNRECANKCRDNSTTQYCCLLVMVLVCTAVLAIGRNVLY